MCSPNAAVVNVAIVTHLDPQVAISEAVTAAEALDKVLIPTPPTPFPSKALSLTQGPCICILDKQLQCF